MSEYYRNILNIHVKQYFSPKKVIPGVIYVAERGMATVLDKR